MEEVSKEHCSGGRESGFIKDDENNVITVIPECFYRGYGVNKPDSRLRHAGMTNLEGFGCEVR